MRYSILRNSDVKVSKLCLGTMTFGEQNTEVEARQKSARLIVASKVTGPAPSMNYLRDGPLSSLGRTSRLAKDCQHSESLQPA